MADKLHPSHLRVRSSDASTFDFICDDCGSTDCVTGGWGSLSRPCSGSVDGDSIKESARVLLRALQKAQIDMKILKKFLNGEPVAALRELAENERTET